MSQRPRLKTMNEQHFYYETMYILRPDIAEDDVNNHIEKYNKLLEEFGGKILDSQMRGKRRLAYQISKHREGIYVQLSHQGDGQHIFKIEKAMRLSEDVIRYMTVKQYGPLPKPKTPNKSSTQSEKIENEDKDVKNVKETKKDTSEDKDVKNIKETKKETSEDKETKNTESSIPEKEASKP